ncbi:hypothetical protein LUZ60_000507 [Juncus effusus]|nr:hypothetical protein LUZ60_000507 [Juncus effusus]
MSSTARAPTWRERENNKRRERRRRAIAAKIYAGLRLYGNYKLPKHCDSNEVLKALCEEAGWVVEEDGTTYRKGSKRPNQTELHMSSFSPSPCSLSYQNSPFGSYNPSPTRTQPGTPTENPNHQNALIPLLKTLNSSKLNMNPNFSTISAPVTPPLSSTPPRSPHSKIARMMSSLELPDLSEPASPTFSLVSSNPFVVGQSGTCSPLNVSDDFAFGIGGNRDVDMMRNELVKPWEGERIHEEFVSDELELTLGSSVTRN